MYCCQGPSILDNGFFYFCGGQKHLLFDIKNVLAAKLQLWLLQCLVLKAHLFLMLRKWSDPEFATASNLLYSPPKKQLA